MYDVCNITYITDITDITYIISSAPIKISDNSIESIKKGPLDNCRKDLDSRDGRTFYYLSIYHNPPFQKCYTFI